MKRIHIFYIALLLLSPFVIAGCSIVGDIFKAGVWFGVLGVIAFVAVVVWLLSKLK